MIIFDQMPIWLSALLLVVVPTSLAMLVVYSIRRLTTLEQLSDNNEVAGFKFAVVGVLYAVVLAFAVLAVWERFSETEGFVATEASAAATIYRLANDFPVADAASVRGALTEYLDVAINEEWPAMASQAESGRTTEALNTLYSATLRIDTSTPQRVAVLSEALTQLDTITQSRRERLVAKDGIVPGILWVALIGGGAMTVGFTFFFGTANLRAQILMTGILALLITLCVLVIVTVEYPFVGQVRVTPEALATVLDDFKDSGAPVRKP